MAARSLDGRLQNLGSRVVSAIGRQEWLDRPSYRFEHLLSFAYNGLGGARNTVSNALHGVWLGHPVHPPLASLTSGALGTTVALDALSLLPGRPATEVRDASKFASRALGVGILAGIGSAVTGVTDWQHTHESDRRVGAVHGLVNLVATALYARSWWDRRRGRHGRGIALTALGYGITVAGSYLGGALVFESGIGIDQSGARLRTTEWTPVLPASSLNGKPVRVEVDGVGLVVCQTKPGEVAAFGELCPHLAAPMSDGWVDRGRLVCPWHGSWFAAESGDVMRGPAAAPLPCYQARLVDGMVEVRGEPEPALGAAVGIGEGKAK
ncbi:Rieske 2Fe-2S domain-containing protein [Mycobacterium nebraskense]|uniref:(2Fe-2S)-binding protein n=1 Tax=Mycobacterium nebraskense TaxID=244292 RepID=A0A0F5NBJ1_9MYCO|nr:Rieske 2Fe-2S domain-containing protein [Mycobacterium nebraskense]KKC04302.1 (2Fe-2S)-binding protein [Mycobacterium nebraskense]KLO38285.1 (2Fe-2S)-binding protein [Mycobacterium nebraskense]MBI2695222.1 Rieske 2Fe-2S domain-containing protein [Mycobacterium nebraskense]MCV7118848.1 Rieske 2Fe-2S domain-containing protein [Mycobacterium nebraskense]ORW20814.1 (2Fe-2S)-binding protein [Mycobacterium nebraskense]